MARSVASTVVGGIVTHDSSSLAADYCVERARRCNLCHRVVRPLWHGFLMTTAAASSLSIPRGAALYIGALLGPGVLLLPGLASSIAGPAAIIAWVALARGFGPVRHGLPRAGDALPVRRRGGDVHRRGPRAPRRQRERLDAFCSPSCSAPRSSAWSAAATSPRSPAAARSRVPRSPPACCVVVLTLGLRGARTTTTAQLVLVAVLIVVIVVAVGGSAPIGPRQQLDAVRPARLAGRRARAPQS